MRKKIIFAASILPLAASTLPVNAETAGRIELPTYSIDFRRAVQIAQVELAKTTSSGLAKESEAITSKTSGGHKDAKGAGGSKWDEAAERERYKTSGGYKDAKGAGGSKTDSGKGPDAYTTGGYKESKGAGGSKWDEAAERERYKTSGGYKDAKGAGGSKTDSGKGPDAYTAGGYKESKDAGGSKSDAGANNDGYKTSGGYKEGKDAGASDASAGKGKAADGYKTSGGLVEYMKSGRSGLGNFDHKADGGLKISAEDNLKRAPRGLGGIKSESDGSTSGAIKIDFESAGKSGLESGPGMPNTIKPIGGEAVGPVKELQVATPLKAAPVLAPVSPALAPATPVAKPAIGGTPLLVPSVLPTK